MCYYSCLERTVLHVGGWLRGELRNGFAMLIVPSCLRDATSEVEGIEHVPLDFFTCSTFTSLGDPENAFLQLLDSQTRVWQEPLHAGNSLPGPTSARFLDILLTQRR